MVKNLPVVQKTRVPSWVGKIPWRRKVATDSSILASEIPWTEKPGGLQSMGLQRAGYDLATKQQHSNNDQFQIHKLNSLDKMYQLFKR